MKEITIVRGDLKNKPAASQQLADYFTSIKNEYEGTLFIGYPIIGTSDGGFQIDALLLTREKGLVVINIVEGVDQVDYKNIQDENYTKIKSKLFQHKNLTNRRELAFEINVLTFAPTWSKVEGYEAIYPCVINNAQLAGYFENSEWLSSKYYEEILSVLQSITSIRKTKIRENTNKPDSYGARLKKIEDSISNLDRHQSAAVIETAEGVQRIRGLAGSGKTIVLALKVAYLHSLNPKWKIAVTFNTRSLKAQFMKYIRVFTFEHISEEPNWENIEVIHAWGTSSSPGIYYNICKENNIPYIDFDNARSLTKMFGEEFDKVCEKAINHVSDFKEKYDLIVIDEAQDFSKEFLRMCYGILKSPKRLVYAYDELQSLNQKVMDSPEILFGNKEDGTPKVILVNDKNNPKQDIILDKCYRNSKEILTTAHALGFGIYRSELVQMFDNSDLWKEVGYSVLSGELKDGSMVSLGRTNESSPDFLSAHTKIDELLIFKSFKHNLEQVDYVVESILKNIQEDELRLDDIMVINANPKLTKSLVGLFREKLYNKGINSSLAGVSSSPDIFYESDAITFTGIYRAKGNEAAMVYFINAQHCYDGLELAKKRNILFTAMTRSKAWLRVCGVGEEMNGLVEEFSKVKENDFKLTFTYPTKAERAKMNIVNRDLSPTEKSDVYNAKKSVTEILKKLQDGKLKREDLPADLRDSLMKLLNNED